MKQIPPHMLWIGHAGDGRDLRHIFAAGIRARVELAAEEAPAPTPRDLIECRFPLVDGGGNDSTVLALALSTLTSLLKQKVPTLVCCGAGMSRSPAIAAGALALLTGAPAEDCLRQVVFHHPADVVPALWSDVINALLSLR
jgi:protein-tyrosine phosphatase